MTESTAWSSTTASSAPQTAPIVVATQRKSPMRMFEIPSRKYAAAAPEEVAITEQSAAPIA